MRYVRKTALQNQGEHSGINGIETNVFLIDKNKIRFLLLFIYLILNKNRAWIKKMC